MSRFARLLPTIVAAMAMLAVVRPLAAQTASSPNTSPININPLSVLSQAGDSLMNRGGAADGAAAGDESDTDSLGPLGSPATGSKAASSKVRPGGLSTSINILLVLTVISLAPSIMLMTTCFVRIVVVLGLLKQALGTQNLPPPQVTVGLSLFMTLLVMSPTLDRINKEAIAPYNSGQIRDYDELWTKARQPMRDFMFDQIERTGNWSSLFMVLNYRGVDTSEPAKLKRADVDMISLVPAYMLSELKAAFLIGFKVYLPFLVIDMVIAAMLISMGMMMLPPVLISLPFKLLLFVLVDGWQLVVGSLMQSFTTHPAPPPSGAATAALGPMLGLG